MLHRAYGAADDMHSILVTQFCILNVLVSRSLWQGMDHLGHAGPTVEQQLFSVDPSVVLIHQCLSLFQPIKAIIWIGAIKPGDLFEGFFDSASLLIFMLLHSFSVFFSLFSFFFHSFSFFLLFLHLVMFQIQPFLSFPLLLQS